MAPIKRPPRLRHKHFIKEWREFIDISQEEAADRIGVNRSTISRVESAETPYDQDILEKLADAYGCTVVELIKVHPSARNAATEAIGYIMDAGPDDQRRAAVMLAHFLKRN